MGTPRKFRVHDSQFAILSVRIDRTSPSLEEGQLSRARGTGQPCTAVFRTKILQVYGVDSIGVFFSRGEHPPTCR